MAEAKPEYYGPHCDIILAALARRAEKTGGETSLRQLGEQVGLGIATLSPLTRGLSPLTHRVYHALAKWPHFYQYELKELAAVADEHSIRASRGSDADASPEMTPDELRRVRAASKRVSKAVDWDIRRGRFIVTGAMLGAEVHEPSLRAVEANLEVLGAKLIILPAPAHHAPLNETEYPLDDLLLEDHWKSVYSSVQFNRSLVAMDFDLRPYKPDPLQGLDSRGAATGTSYIFSHPTQRLLHLPNGFSDVPRVQACTGLITQPKYRMHTHQGKRAAERHVLGALYVQITGDQFHIQQLQFAPDGSFVVVTGEGPKLFRSKAKPVAVKAAYLARGDDHGGPQIAGDVRANDAVDELTALAKPAVVTVEDVFDGASISHHYAGRRNQSVARPAAAHSLCSEVEATRAHLERIRTKMPTGSQLVVKWSNHNSFLMRYLDEGRFVHDGDDNYLYALDLAKAYHGRGRNPVQIAVDPDSKLAKWLGPAESFKFVGVELGDHGDVGPNGSHGSTRGVRRAHGLASAGHVHAAEILDGVYRSGHLGLQRQAYNAAGPSSWVHAVEVCVLNPDGVTLHRTLINIIRGSWQS